MLWKKEMVSNIGKGAFSMQNEKDWTVLKFCLLVVFLSYVILYTVEAM